MFAEFSAQDSGHLSYGVAYGGQRCFTKTARTPTTVKALRSAARFHAAVHHPAIVPQLALVELPGGGRYQVVNRASGLALNVIGASTGNGAYLDQETVSGAAAQLWTVAKIN